MPTFNLNDYSMPRLLRDYLMYLLTIKGRSARTVEGYFIDLRLFLRFRVAVDRGLSMETPDLEDVPLSDVTDAFICSSTLSDAYAFLNYVQTTNSNNAKTRARKVSSLRGFFKYIYGKTDLMKENPMENLELPSVRKTVPKYLTLEESLKLLSVIDGPARERDYCMITLMLNCGMRLSELVGIKMNSVRDNTLVLLGKGNKERMIYLNDACLAAIEAYKKVRQEPKIEKNKPYLFLSSHGTPLSGRRVEQIVEANLKKAGLDGRGYSPHKLRHTAATLMYQHGGVDVKVLQEILGHANLATTEIYTHVSDRQMENAASRSPLAEVMPPKKNKPPEP